jgi:dCTP deaminase
VNDILLDQGNLLARRELGLPIERPSSLIVQILRELASKGFLPAVDFKVPKMAQKYWNRAVNAAGPEPGPALFTAAAAGDSKMRFRVPAGAAEIPPACNRPARTDHANRSRMSIQSDRWIREQALKHRMIEPFSEKQVASGVISYGLSSYGYDLRVSNEFKIFTNVNSAIIDPKAFDERSFVSVQAESVIVPPNSFALARSVEYFRIPRDVLTICVGKSTYARCGIIVNVTPFEPEWEGFVTLEISNTTPLPAKIYANEGLCQILFFRGDQPCEVSYADRKGKYQKQQGIVLPKL